MEMQMEIFHFFSQQFGLILIPPPTPPPPLQKKNTLRLNKTQRPHPHTSLKIISFLTWLNLKLAHADQADTERLPLTFPAGGWGQRMLRKTKTLNENANGSLGKHPLATTVSNLLAEMY